MDRRNTDTKRHSTFYADEFDPIKRTGVATLSHSDNHDADTTSSLSSTVFGGSLSGVAGSGSLLSGMSNNTSGFGSMGGGGGGPGGGSGLAVGGSNTSLPHSSSLHGFTNIDNSSSYGSLRDLDQTDTAVKRSVENLADCIRNREPLNERETKIQMVMKNREREYTSKKSLRLFCGTYNVNGQSPTESLQPWLYCDGPPPDIYAIGFQELDLSKNAYIFTESAREGEWMNRIHAAINNDPRVQYVKLKVHRLVAMMLVVYVKQEHHRFVRNVYASQVATGIMSVLGNKGGVGIGFSLYDSTICFINSHLAAHQDEIERRNQDYQQISKAMNLGGKTIDNHDLVFWLGDFNYRLDDVDRDTCTLFVSENNLEHLLNCDQLKKQMIMKKVFNDFSEAEIKFAPTYKYDPGTDRWDSSEKGRKPAWCDRILWRGDDVVSTSYTSHSIVKISDHKPVSANYIVPVKIINKEQEKAVYEDVMKFLDRWENELLPQVTLDTTELTYNRVKFLDTQTKTIKITNTGKSLVQFEFINKLNEKHHCKKWLEINPVASKIDVGRSKEIVIEVLVDKETVASLNAGKDTLEDILVLHLRGGKDLFISVSGSYEATSFGMPVKSLVKMYGAINEVPTATLIDLSDDGSGAPSPDGDTTDRGAGSFDVPKEIWRLVEHLYKNALDMEDLFRHPGLHSEIQQIRDCLDTGTPAEIPGGVHSVAEALMLFLECFPQPVIPRAFHERCIQAAKNPLLCKQVILQLPKPHRLLFEYLCSFFRELLQHPANKLDINTLATTFGELFLRDQKRYKHNQNDKRMFMKHFLSADYEGDPKVSDLHY